MTAPAPATEKQVSFLKTLLSEREVDPKFAEGCAIRLAAWDTWHGAGAWLVDGEAPEGVLLKGDASACIERALAAPKLPKPKTTYVDPPAGMHKNAAGQYVKVYTTRNGYTVAKVLVERMSEVESETGPLTKWEFDYRGRGGLKGLDETTKLTWEEAKAFGKTYGICVNCAAHLTDERSIYAGYGPVCADNHGWPYPSMAEAMEGLDGGVAALVATPAEEVTYTGFDGKRYGEDGRVLELYGLADGSLGTFAEKAAEAKSPSAADLLFGDELPEEE